MSHLRNTHRLAFSLIEVVFSLAVLTFAGISLLGVLATVLQTTQNPKSALQAASIVESLCSTRRAAPTTDFSLPTSPQPNFPIPALSGSANNFTSPTYITWDGASTTLADPNVRFGLLYKIVAPANYIAGTSPGTATVYISLYWPPQASPTSNANVGHFEVTTTFFLP